MAISQQKKYRVVKVYPNIVQTEYSAGGNKLTRSFSHWSALKAIGKIKSVNLDDILPEGRLENRRSAEPARKRDLLNDEDFLKACEGYAAGKITSMTKAGEACGISHSTFRKFYAMWLEQRGRQNEAERRENDESNNLSAARNSHMQAL